MTKKIVSEKVTSRTSSKKNKKKSKAARRPTKTSTRTASRTAKDLLHQRLVVEICAAATSTVVHLDAGEPNTSVAMMVAANVLLEMARQVLRSVPDDLMAALERTSREEALTFVRGRKSGPVAEDRVDLNI